MSVSAQNIYNQRWEIMASEGVFAGFSTRCCGMTSPLCQKVIKPAEDLSASFFFSFGAASSASRLFLYSLGLVVNWKRWQVEEKTNLLLLFPASLLSVCTSRSGLIKCELYNNLILAVYDNRHKNTGHDRWLQVEACLLTLTELTCEGGPHGEVMLVYAQKVAGLHLPCFGSIHNLLRQRTGNKQTERRGFHSATTVWA